MKQSRQASIELLRVICIVMIIFHHMGPWLESQDAFQPAYPVVQSYNFIANRFFNFHVDVFILISGYFGIYHWTRKFGTILVLLWFYLISFNLVSFILSGEINWWQLLNPVQEHPWWFICNYVYLLLLSPYLNRLTDCMRSVHDWQKLLGLCLVFEVYFCWFLKEPKINYYGHNLITFVAMYIGGRWLASDYSVPFRMWCKKIGGGNMWISFLVVCLGIALISIVNNVLHLDLTLPDYNSPTTLFAGIVFFLVFCDWKMKPHKWITFLSESAVAVYLVHTYPLVKDYIVRIFWQLYAIVNDNVILSCIYVLLFVFSLYFIICCLDKSRIFISRLIMKQLTHITSKYF